MDEFNFNFNNTLQNDSYNYSSNTFDYDEGRKDKFIMHVVTCIIVAIGLPLTLVAIYALYSLVRSDHVAPLYVINLLISDLIQLCSMTLWESWPVKWRTYSVMCIYELSLMASVGFMVCVAMERYLVIAHPLWYRFRRSIKISVVVCVFVWVSPLTLFFTSHFLVDHRVSDAISAVYLLIPLPLFVFFLGGTLKALSRSRSVSADEKRRIVGTLVLVLLIYTMLFLPKIVSMSFHVLRNKCNKTLCDLSYMFFKLSPLADLVLYIFMRRGAVDRLLACLCSCRMDSNDDSKSTA